jgi:uncharacterized membrane protein
MAFCPNCGSQVAGSFCANCGTSMGAAGQGAPPPPPGAGFQQAQPLSAPGLTDNVAGALCYLFWFVTGIVFLVIAPYNQNKFIRFHAFQAIFFNLAWIALYIALGLLSVITHIGFLLYPVVGLAGFVLWLYLMFQAYNGKKFKLPVIGDLAEKQA